MAEIWKDMEPKKLFEFLRLKFTIEEWEDGRPLVGTITPQEDNWALEPGEIRELIEALDLDPEGICIGIRDIYVTLPKFGRFLSDEIEAVIKEEMTESKETD